MKNNIEEIKSKLILEQDEQILYESSAHVDKTDMQLGRKDFYIFISNDIFLDNSNFSKNFGIFSSNNFYNMFDICIYI